MILRDSCQEHWCFNRHWVFLAASCLLISHNPDAVLHPKLWAEDGAVWLRDGYTIGWTSLLTPHTGYLQTFPRLIALLAVMFPLTWTPTIFVFVSLIVQLIPIALILSKRGAAIIPDNALRITLVVAYVAAPNLYETFVNLTNAQWHLVIIVFLLVELPSPRKKSLKYIQLLVLFVQGLSGPFSIFLAPLSWWRAYEEKEDGRFKIAQAAMITITGATQLCVVLTSPPAARSILPLGANIGGLGRILDIQLFMRSIGGEPFVENIITRQIWQTEDVIPIIIMTMGFAIFAVAYFRGTQTLKRFFLLSFIILAASLISPVGSTTNPLWVGLEVPGAGSRYYLLPILSWLIAVSYLTFSKLYVERVFGRMILIISIFGIQSDWQYTPQPSTGFSVTAKAFENAPPGQVFIFREDPNPLAWVFALTKK